MGQTGTAEVALEGPVFVASDGTICHAPCGQAMQAIGAQGAPRLRLWCPDCGHHLSLPVHSFAELPMSMRWEGVRA
jgi:hypothetical protein